MKAGDEVIFKLIDVEDEKPRGTASGGIVFVPGEGFQSAMYYNGSDTWRSTVTKNTIEPTYWLKLIKNNVAV